MEPQRTFQQKEKPSSNLDIKVQMSSGDSLDGSHPGGAACLAQAKHRG